MTSETVSEVMHPILGAPDSYLPSNDGIYNYLCYYPPEIQEPEQPTTHTIVLLSGTNGLFLIGWILVS